MYKDKVYKVGIYMRLSREDEIKKNESESIKNQRSFILDYLKQNGYSLYKEYYDDGYTGTNFERPGFKKLINDIENGLINLVVTKDMSRLGRELSESCYYIEKYFPEKNIRYVAISDGIDTYIDCLGNDMIGFRALFNDWYCKDISKKIKASIITKKKQGKFLGAYAPYGYLKDPKNKYHLIPDPNTSEIVRHIYDMFLEGYSLQKIAGYLTKKKIPKPSVYKNIKCSIKTKEIWDERTIGNILQNPNYTGNLVQGRRKKINYKSKKVISTLKKEWVIVDNTHDPIISKEKFELVQNIYRKNIKKSNQEDMVLLKGFLRCKECGHTIGINLSGDKKRHYTICNHYRKYSKKNFCTPHSIRYEELEKIIVDEIRKISKIGIDKEKLKLMIDKHNKNDTMLREIDKSIGRCHLVISNNTEAIKTVYKDKIRGVVDLKVYKEVYNELTNEIKDNKRLIEELEKNKHKLLDNMNIHNDKEKFENYLFSKNPSRKLLSCIIDKILIDKEKKIEIYFRIKNSLI